MSARSSDQVQRVAFTTDAGVGPRALLGLIVLETDRTVEAEVRSLRLDGVAHHVSRIPMDVTVTAETLRAMEARIPVAAGLLPPAFGFDAIGYACTSGATLIGAERVAAAVGIAHPGVSCTDPITAALAAFRTLDVRSIGLLTPYNAEVTLGMAAHYEDQGIEVAAVASFLEEDDNVVGSITEASVADAVRRIGVEQATMANTLARMQRDGLIARQRSKADGRVQEIRLTDRGQSLRGPAIDAALAVNDTALASLSPEEREQFLGLMGKIIRTFDHDGEGADAAD